MAGEVVPAIGTTSSRERDPVGADVRPSAHATMRGDMWVLSGGHVYGRRSNGMLEQPSWTCKH